MDPLEGTTLDLIYRRRVRTFYPGYTMILMVLGMIVALPLVKVDVVSSSGGMIRPHAEPAVMVAPISGMVDSTVLREHLKVITGDTVVWIRRDLPETRIREYQELIGQNRGSIGDITSILQGRSPVVTSRYIQSYRNHLAARTHMQIQNDFLHGEFMAAEQLFGQEVIPASEYEQARSDYLLSCARMEDHRESYKSLLEDERYRLQLENRSYRGEIATIKASLQDFFVVAPATGILRQCPGITGGSIIQQGNKLGTISPEGRLVAECYVETRDIPVIKKGMPVRIRFDGKSHQSGSRLETEVSQIDPDAVVMNGKPVYRIRCFLEDPYLISGSGKREPVILGMTFSASMLLYRATLASLLLEKLNRWANPALASDPPTDP
jgi:multidrug resistance efflux pump